MLTHQAGHQSSWGWSIGSSHHIIFECTLKPTHHSFPGLQSNLPVASHESQQRNTCGIISLVPPESASRPPFVFWWLNDNIIRKLMSLMSFGYVSSQISTKSIISQIEERESSLKRQKRQSCKDYYLVSIMACSFEWVKIDNALVHWSKRQKCDQELNISIEVKILGCLIIKLEYGLIWQMESMSIMHWYFVEDGRNVIKILMFQ